MVFESNMGILVKKNKLGFGLRLWSYGIIKVSYVINKILIEERFVDNTEEDNYQLSVLKYT